MESDSNFLIQLCLSTSWGGLEMVALEFARNFRRKNFNVVTVCVAGSPLAQHLRAEGLSAQLLPAQGFFRQRRRLAAFLRDHPKAPVLCQHLRDLWKIVPLVYFHKNKIIGLSHSFLGISKKDPWHTLLYRRLDRLVCLTPLHKKNLEENLRFPPHKISIIPNEVDTRRFCPEKRSRFCRENLNIPAHKFLVGVVGRLDPQKGQQDAVLAMSALRNYEDRLHLVIVGEDTLNTRGTGEKLKTMVSELGLERMVSLTGFFESTETIMASLDLLLVPSHRETFGRVIIEAMASGTPVIATDSGGVPDIIEDGQSGLLVPPRNPGRLALAVERILLSTDLQNRLRRAGLKRVQAEFSADIVENRLEKMILSVG